MAIHIALMVRVTIRAAIAIEALLNGGHKIIAVTTVADAEIIIWYEEKS